MHTIFTRESLSWSNISVHVSMRKVNNYGPIADNAGGIAEMSMQPQEVRDVTDRLDAAGNVTKAVTKVRLGSRRSMVVQQTSQPCCLFALQGYSIGSASMACFLLFGAFMDEFSEFSGRDFHSVDIATPEVLIGGLIGSMLIFLFTGLTISAVGRTAHEVCLFYLSICATRDVLIIQSAMRACSGCTGSETTV